MVGVGGVVVRWSECNVKVKSAHFRGLEGFPAEGVTALFATAVNSGGGVFQENVVV